MRKRTWSPLYSLLYPLVTLAARLFYRRWKVLGRNRFPKSGKPVIVVSNHQNALLDPLLCCITAPRQMHFLTRADVFRNKLFRPVIFALNMMPVYRGHDPETGKNKRNQETFEVAIARLSRGAAIGIFPEGNHGARKLLRPMKKGLAHLLDLAAQKGLKDIQIVPIAVDYSEYDHARSSLVVNFGDAFTVDNLLFDDQNEDKRSRHIATMQRIKDRLSDVMVDVGPSDWYAFFRMCEAHILNIYGYKNWSKAHKALQQFRNKVLASPSEFEAHKEMGEIQTSLKNASLDFNTLYQELNAGKLALAFLALPLALPAIILLTLPWQLALIITRKIVVDPCFNSTFRLVFGLLCILPGWIISAVVLGSLLPHNPWWMYLIGIFISGIIALPVMDQIRDFLNQRRKKNWIRQNPEFHATWKTVRSVLDNQTF